MGVFDQKHFILDECSWRIENQKCQNLWFCINGLFVLKIMACFLCGFFFFFLFLEGLELDGGVIALIVSAMRAQAQ